MQTAPELPCGQMANTLVLAAQRFNGQPAISRGERVCMTYREFGERAAAIAGGLTTAGLRPGDVVALVMTNHEDYLPVLFGVWHAGLVAAPQNPRLPPEQLRQQLEHVEAAACILTPDRAEHLAPMTEGLGKLRISLVVETDEFAHLAAHPPIPVVEPTAGAHGPAWLFGTSGTTGRPKAAVLSHHNLASMASMYLQFDRADEPSDRESDDAIVRPGANLLHITPISHGSGMAAIPHILRGANHVIPASGGFDVQELFALIRRWPGACICVAPIMLRALVSVVANNPEHLAGLETIIYGSAPTHLAHLEQIVDVFGPRLVQVYGMGEAPASITCLSRTDHTADEDQPRRRERLASAGRPLPGVELRVVDQHGDSLPVGEVGQVLCRSDAVMSGYWRDSEASATALQDGWLWTGDLGSLDADGYLTLDGRVADVVIAHGATIHPRAIEDVLARHPQVCDVAVVGHRAPEDKHEVVACVAADRDIPIAEVRALCAAQLPSEQLPDDFFVLDSLPVNHHGKLLRASLRKRLAERDRDSARAYTESPWRRYDLLTPDGYRVRIGATMRDAELARDILRSAWRLSDDESYFYGAFEDPESLFRQVIAPANRVADIHELSTLCVMVESEARRVVASGAMIFDHRRRTVELGRTGTAHNARGRGVLRQFDNFVKRLLQAEVPDYLVIVDATTLIQSAGRFSDRVVGPPLAFYPSSFTVQPNSVDEWLARLTRRHGANVGHALLSRSEETGLGRFAIAYHVGIPLGFTTGEPRLTAAQRPFYEYTRTVLGLQQGHAPQTAPDGPEVSNRVYTATRTITDPAPEMEPADVLKSAASEGFELVVVNVPCDPQHQTCSERLERAQALLCGVYPDAFGRWRAGYAIFTSPTHRDQVIASFVTLVDHRGVVDSQLRLLRLILASTGTPSFE